LKKIDSNQYKSILEFGTRNLEAHCTQINELNVFPIPDGDTGTNMVLTLKNGLKAISDSSSFLPVLCADFASAIVLGARGNSGVIISMFFKGISDVFAKNTEIAVSNFIKAFENGVNLAYDAVAHPVEGTILTVLKDSLDALRKSEKKLSDFEEAISLVYETSRLSLERTPELLPILKKAGVVDSGAAGLVYFFEGALKYFRGENIDVNDAVEAVYVDYSAYNRKSTFEFGFCTEILLQLLDSKEAFEYDAFKKTLKTLGGSIVLSKEEDKIKIHLHTLLPEKVMIYCHRFGEFLSVKIENMTVQHKRSAQKFLRTAYSEDCSFAVVSVAFDKLVQKTLSQMGSDVVILGKEAPSSADFLEAFQLSRKKDILVFPNSSNAVMSAQQAASLYDQGSVTVLDCTSVAACYAFLAELDFEQTDLSKIKKSFAQTIRDLLIIQISKATRDVAFDNQAINKDDFFAYHEKEIFGIDSALNALVTKVVKKIAHKKEVSVISLFFGKMVSELQREALLEELGKNFKEIEFLTIPTEDTVCHITVSLES